MPLNRKASAAPTPRHDPPDRLSALEKRFFLHFEGQAPPTGGQVAQALNLSRARAYKLLAKLRREGVLRYMCARRLGDGICHAVTLLRIDSTDPRGFAAFDRWVVEDRAIVSAVLLTGDHHYRIQSVHADAEEAWAWFRAVMKQRGVVDGYIRHQHILWDRPYHAAALWPPAVGDGGSF